MIERVPSTSDKHWKWTTFPLLEFLRTGKKTWDEMYAWAKNNRVTQEILVNMIAWLESKGLAVGSKSGWKASPNIKMSGKVKRLMPTIHALHEKGYSIRAIAKATRLSKITVIRYVESREKSEAMRLYHKRLHEKGVFILPPWYHKRAVIVGMRKGE